MKITQLLMVPVAALVLSSCNGGMSSGKIETTADSVSYVIGAADGERLQADFSRSGLDSLMDMKVLFSAFYAGAKEKELKMVPDSNMAFLQKFNQEFQGYMMKKMRDTTGTLSFDKSKAYMDSVAYLIGANYGSSLANGFAENGLDTIISMDLFIQGFKASALQEDLELLVEENMPMVNKFFQKLQEDRAMAQFGDNIKAGEEYLAKNGALSEVTTTASGLQYEVLVEGNGPKPSARDRVKVHYHGTLVDGTVFDSSVERGEPATFGVGQVIRGWTEALQLMPVGSKWKVTIPYDLAYGERGAGQDIAPYSTLIFEVELLEIVK